MTWLDKYRLAIRLASIYSWEYSEDIAHDAWISYMKSNNSDLFEIHLEGYNYYLSRIIRRSFLKWLKKERLFNSKGDRYIYFGADELQSNLTAPDEAIFAQDLHTYLLRKIKEQSKSTGRPARVPLEEVFELKAHGYTQGDIADKLGVDKSIINRYNKKMSLVNPFNGNKLKITRTINKDTWDKKTDKDDYELDDYNEWFMLFRHVESDQGLLVRLNKDK